MVLPRVGAVKMILDTLAPPNGERHLDYLVDITMGHEIETQVFIANCGVRWENRSFFLYRVYKVDDVSFRFKFNRFGKYLMFGFI